MKPRIIALFLAFIAMNAPAVAQEFPTRAVTIIVPYAAGGSTDSLTRIIGDKLAQKWGQPVVIVNRPGGGTSIGAEMVAKAAPDGYTILMGSVPTFGINPHLMKAWTLDPRKVFAPICLVGITPVWLVLHPSIPATSLREVEALARAKPGALTFGMTALGSTGHLAMELWKKSAKIDVTAVPYKGSSQSAMALLGGEVTGNFDVLGPSAPHVKEGKARPIALIQAKRSALVPDLPTFAELGHPQVDIVSYFGLVAPAGTPLALREKVAADVREAVTLADVREKLAVLYIETVVDSPAEFAAKIAREYETYGKLIREAGISVD